LEWVKQHWENYILKGTTQGREFENILNNLPSLHWIRAIPFRIHCKISLPFVDISRYSGNTLTPQNETDRVYLECQSSLKAPSRWHTEQSWGNWLRDQNSALSECDKVFNKKWHKSHSQTWVVEVSWRRKTSQHTRKRGNWPKLRLCDYRPKAKVRPCQDVH
jgi:hypothetical protein